MAATSQLYWEDTYQFNGDANVLAVNESSTDPTKWLIVLDRTIFHPQGGGQPSDRGIITADGISFKVSHVSARKEDKVIEHLGEFLDGQRFEAGAVVTLAVDEDLRRLHARLHSAGHLLDAALRNLGWTQLEPSKGYHFTDNPYVEYNGEVKEADRPGLIDSLNGELIRMIAADVAVAVQYDAATGVRLVDVAGVECPCGGTHVKKLGEIQRVKVTRIKKNKQTIRISYEL